MTTDSAEQRSATTRARWLAGMLLGVGATHFAWPKPFDTIVPAELPGPARFYTYASGVAEVATGGLLLVPRTRRQGGLAAALLFLAVLPGNINAVRLYWSKPWLRAAMIARLPLQIPMITAALRVWRAG
ncbi:MAG: MauE/DoxX family redox-associated membrane protein [Mycobacterium sp.]